MTKIFSLRDQNYFPAVTRKLNKIYIFFQILAPQMSYAVILVAWLAMMPQLMPKQTSVIGPCQHFSQPMSTMSCSKAGLNHTVDGALSFSPSFLSSIFFLCAAFTLSMAALQMKRGGNCAMCHKTSCSCAFAFWISLTHSMSHYMHACTPL